MKKSIGVAAAVGTVTALVALTPAGAATQTHSAALAKASASVHAAHQSRETLPISYFYIYSSTNYGNLCTRLSVATGSTGNGNSYNLSDEGCRNVDESIDNASPTAVRLYFAPNDGGAWTCVPANMEIANLNQQKYQFNSGGSGLGEEVWENVASVQASTSNDCNDPIGTNNPSSIARR